MKLLDWFASDQELYRYLNGTITIQSYAYQFLWVELPIVIFIIIAIIGTICFVCVAQNQKLFCRDFKYLEYSPKTKCISLLVSVIMGILVLGSAGVGIGFLSYLSKGIKQGDCYMNTVSTTLSNGDPSNCVNTWIGLESVASYIQNINISYSNTLAPAQVFINSLKQLNDSVISQFSTNLNNLVGNYSNMSFTSPSNGAQSPTKFTAVY